MTTLDDDTTTSSSGESEYRLLDRYLADEGRVFMTGVQALARLPLEQLRADRAAGLNTAALASGYPGSPLGGIDGDFAHAASVSPELPFVVQPAVNEELAATTIVGTQLAGEQADKKYDGVLGLWYGKAQGLDRACDALRHGVFGGASRHGGAVVLVGDDPGAKSSVVPSSSDLALLDLHLPCFYPGDVSDVVELGRHAVAMSRLTGLWTAMKIVSPVADGSGTVELDTFRTDLVVPDMRIEGVADHHTVDMTLLPPHNMDIELDIRTTRMERARRYLEANPLNRIHGDTSTDAWMGLVATGHTFHELREALRRLGIESDDALRAAGIRLLELRVPIPFERGITREFAAGLRNVFVVEEKDPTLELYVKDALYGMADSPYVVGKRDRDDQVLIPNYGPLYADTITPAVRRVLEPTLGERLAPPPPAIREKQLIPLSVERAPYFCSGCPHNWGTKVPEGDVAIGAGVGCHTMAMIMEPERVGNITGITQMGGEGAQWIGMSPFVEREHFIQNLGDGTFFHSGQLAVQAAIAAEQRITYKLLFNGTVAMTGGQDPVGQLGVPEIADVLIDHGVKRVIVTTDDTEKYRGVDMPSDEAGTVKVLDRIHIVEAQEQLAEVDGVTVLIHDQACAAQARRLRKRGKMATPTSRVVINHRICEACGDCGEVSNCLSVQAVDTPLGVKTTIDQTTCNLDMSCLHGDCPSFMTVEPAEDASGSAVVPGSTNPLDAAPSDLPAPELRVPADSLDLRIAGVGGTGVVTAAQIIATAAMLDGWDTRGLDQTGLSQKAGPVVSDIRFRRGDAPTSNLLGDATADALVAFDLLAAATERNLAACRTDHTVVVGSSTATPTGSMIGHADRTLPTLEDLRERLATSTDADATRLADAGAITEALLGNATTANTFVIGAAVQFGALPFAPEAIERAIGLNGVAVDANVAAFRWGRSWAADADRVEQLAASASLAATPEITVDELSPKLRRRVDALATTAEIRDVVEMLAADLVGYQNAKYARSFLDHVERVAAEHDDELTETAARSLHKLMAYKDEYEVARLLLLPDAGQAPAEAVGGVGAKVTWRLHPPMLKALGMDRKLGIDARIGRPMMATLAAGKRLRGTKLDPFGRSEMRRAEQALVPEYVDFLDAELRHLGQHPAARADVLAALALPMGIRGYEGLKMRRIAEYHDAAAARAEARATTAS
ncbi:MAG: indolepyruvate ferredoxin oxidoreductase family protein [Ilumatobacter sp.]